MGKTPVVSVRHFQGEHAGSDFYGSLLKPHIETHAITKIPHKHDFYFVVFFTKGNGVHEIDFVKYNVKPGALFIMRPGQMHVWQLSKDAQGYVIIHSGPFYEEGLQSVRISDHSFFGPFNHSPVLFLNTQQRKNMEELMKPLVLEYGHNKKYKSEKIRALLTVMYIEIARNDSAEPIPSGNRYLVKLREFEQQLDHHHTHLHLPSEYASRLNISERHLNRITQSGLGKSSSALIHEKLILEAKRQLTGLQVSIAEVSESLGFNDPSYFSRFFARETGMTPSEFVRRLVASGPQRT